MQPALILPKIVIWDKTKFRWVKRMNSIVREPYLGPHSRVCAKWTPPSGNLIATRNKIGLDSLISNWCLKISMTLYESDNQVLMSENQLFWQFWGQVFTTGIKCIPIEFVFHVDFNGAISFEIEPLYDVIPVWSWSKNPKNHGKKVNEGRIESSFCVWMFATDTRTIFIK